jgi:hypothetical protein
MSADSDRFGGAVVESWVVGEGNLHVVKLRMIGVGLETVRE